MKKTSLAPILKNISPLGYTDAVPFCLKKIELQRKTAIFTPNSEMIYRAIKSEKINEILLSADVLFPDGVGIYLSMKALGFSPCERTAGIELGEKLLHESAKRGYKVFLLGSKIGVAERAAKRLRSKYRGLNICGYHHGYFEKSGKENDKVIDKINRSGADIVFVCFGFPSQELWIKENLPLLGSVKLAIGLGGSLDVWAGKVKRAPAIMSSMGLEWLWRVIKEPKRLPRTLNLVLFLYIALKEVLFNRQNRYKYYEIDNFSK